MKLADNAKAPRPRRRHVYVIEGYAFLPHPEMRGVWLRVEQCVLLVDCEHCGAKTGHLCIGKQGPTVTTHWKRRLAARGKAKLLAGARSSNAVLHVTLGDLSVSR